MAKTLTVYLAADLKKFNSGMRDAQTSVKGFGGSLQNFLGPALIAAGAAAGAFAVKLGVDGVKAAMEDEAAVAALATTLDNLNMSHDTQAVEDYIYQLERAYGVADTDLRPAYDRLIRSTKDVQEANEALKISMDISAATGKSLETITDALGRAYDGNTVSLGRLGLGIDRTALASMSLDQIMENLAKTFGGQADAQARTFEGQLQRLTTATDNLKEAFGAGLLEALGDTDDTTQDLVETMEGFEPVLRGIGRAAGTFATAGLKAYTDAAKDAEQQTRETEAQMRGLEKTGLIVGTLFGEIFASLTGPNSPVGVALRGFGSVGEAATELQLSADRLSGDSIPDLNRELEAQNFTIAASNRLYQDAASRAQRLAAELEDVDETSRNAAGGTEKLTKAQQRLLDLYEVQGIALATTKQELIDQIGALELATKAVEDYANTIQQQLLGGLDLIGAYEAAKEGGGDLSLGLAEGFQRQIDQIEWAGNVLNALKAANVEQSLIEYLAAQGPEAGGALGQALLDDRGLLGTINEQWAGIQERTKELALGLVPEFLEAGRLSAIDNLKGLAEQFKQDQGKFKKLGKAIGQQVGASFKQQIAKDVAEAVRAVEAAATAARAERVAAAEAEQARITQQAVATAISNLIRDSDQRSGRNVQPILQ